MAMRVLHELIVPIQAALSICIMADETTDAKEQVVVCLRWVHVGDIFEPHEVFIG